MNKTRRYGVVVLPSSAPTQRWEFHENVLDALADAAALAHSLSGIKGSVVVYDFYLGSQIVHSIKFGGADDQLKEEK